MPIYSFRFDSMWRGLSAVIKDSAGSEVAGSPVTLDSSGAGDIELDEGVYRAYVTDGARPNARTSSVDLNYDVPETIEEVANQPGASETAYLIAAGVETPDTDSTEVDAEMAYVGGSTEVDWLVLEDGGFTLTEEAGGVFISLRVKGEADFTATDTPPDGESVNVYVTMSRNGSGSGTPSPSATADADGVEDVVVIPAGDAQGYFILGGSFTFVVACYADTVTDGTASVDTIVNITRVAPGPVFA